MYDLTQLQGLFGGGGGFPQAPAANPPFMAGGLPQMTPLQGMGLQSPFLTERPAQALPTQGFMPTRTNAMGPNAMAMLGMNPNMPNMVGPTSALPPEMQPQASQLKMWGMEDQMANQQPQQPGGPGQQPGMTTNPAPGYLQQNPYYREGPVHPALGPNSAQLAAFGINSPFASPRDLQTFLYMSDWANGG
ncbi:MAG: hypothetical protein WBP44_14650 [Gammaproteobacteria bacterium]